MTPDFEIHDLPSFKTVTGNRYELAGLYFFQQLDCLVKLAYKVACDFFNRPEYYTTLDGSLEAGRSVAEALAQLHARFGCHEKFPSDLQRDQIFLPIFGGGGAPLPPASEQGSFPNLRDELLEAAAAFSEHVPFDSGVTALRTRFIQALGLMRDYLKRREGDSEDYAKPLPVILTYRSDLQIP